MLKLFYFQPPTGIGKSLIAASIAGYFGSSFVVTASKHLQDQYTKDMPWLKPNKGMPNFACHKIMEKHGIEFTEIDFAIQNKWTCDMGTCFDKKNKKRMQIQAKTYRSCRRKNKTRRLFILFTKISELGFFTFHMELCVLFSDDEISKRKICTISKQKSCNF